MVLNNVIVVGREANILKLVHPISENVYAADNTTEALDITRRITPDLIVFDSSTAEESVKQFIQHAEGIEEILLFLIKMIGDDSEYEISSIEKGGFRHIDCVQNHHELHKVINDLKHQSSLEGTVEDKERFFCDPLAVQASMAGQSISMRHTMKMIKLVASSQCNPILIIGEMGTGKELAAKAIHFQRCPDKEFIAVNCASLNANLLESELFGHEKGAFTSAEREKTGLLELAKDGCVFLDEITEMPLELQAKLLRVIQEKTFRKVGGTKEIVCKATIIASSNRDLKKEVHNGGFRGDLYHRLNIFPVVLAPLRSSGRCSDIGLYAEYFLKTQTICPEKIRSVRSLTKLAIEALEKHDWPGNVRELRNVIDRAVLLETTNKIGLNSIIVDPENPESFFKERTEAKIKDYSLARAEQELIACVLRETKWQKTRAAELLGISRATLYAKVKQHNIPAGPSEDTTHYTAVDSPIEEEAFA